jgi:hypothetical protein
MTEKSLTDLADRLRTALGGGAGEGSDEADILAPGSVWNLSQTVQHCAQTVSYSVTGYPRLKPALVRAVIGPVVKKAFLRRGAMKHPLGAPIEGAPALDPALPVSEAVARLDEAVKLFTAYEGAPAPHPTYGRCAHDEFARLHAMHLAEHLPGLATG